MFRNLRKAGAYWLEDEASQLGAALAYYSLFSLTPVLVIALMVAGQVFGRDKARGELLDEVESFSGEESRAAVDSMLTNFRYPGKNPIAAVIGIGTLLFGSFGLFTQLRSALARIWRLPPQKHGWMTGVTKTYLLALLMVLVASAFVLLLLTASAVLPVLLHDQVRDLPGNGWLVRLGDFGATVILVWLLFIFTFRFLSDGRIRYRKLSGGAFVGAFLFCIGKLAIGYYLSYTHIGSAFGVAGSLVVLLVWIYYSSQIFFFGAEVVRVSIEQG